MKASTGKIMMKETPVKQRKAAHRIMGRMNSAKLLYLYAKKKIFHMQDKWDSMLLSSLVGKVSTLLTLTILTQK